MGVTLRSRTRTRKNMSSTSFRPLLYRDVADRCSLITEFRIQKRVEEQFTAFVTGFNELIPPDLVNVFDERELELLIGGIADIDIEDWKKHTDYRGYTESDEVIVNFWKVSYPPPPPSHSELRIPSQISFTNSTFVSYSVSAAGTPSRNPASSSSQPAPPASPSTASRTSRAATGRGDSLSRSRASRRNCLNHILGTLLLASSLVSPVVARC